MRASSCGTLRVDFPAISTTTSRTWIPARSAGPPGCRSRITTPSGRASASVRAISRRHVVRADAEPAARHLAVAHDLLEHRARQRHRDREPDAERAAGLRVDRAVDADQVAGGIDQRAAGIARIDRRVGLDEILEAVDAQVVAAKRADDAQRHRAAESERVADGQHHVADLEILGVAEGHRRAGLSSSALSTARSDSGSVPRTCAAPAARRRAPAGCRRRRRSRDDWSARSLRRETITPEPRLVCFRCGRALEIGKEAAEQRVVRKRIAGADGLAGVDVHDRRHGLLCGVRIARDAGRLRSAWRPRCVTMTLPALPDSARQQVRAQRRDDEQRRHAERAGLREEQPEAVQHGVSIVVRRLRGAVAGRRRGATRSRARKRADSGRCNAGESVVVRLPADGANPV